MSLTTMIERRAWTIFLLLALGSGSVLHAWAQADAQPGNARESKPQAGAAIPNTFDSARTTWRRNLAQTPRPKRGCFTATYPDMQWKEVACAQAPNKPFPPKHGARGMTVGNGVDYAANTTGATTAAEGLFPSVIGVTSESSVQPQQATGTPNDFTLQLNTQFFQTQTCSGSSAPNKCLGWEQFVVENNANEGAASFVFIQYWLLKYNTTCPVGWNTYTSQDDTYCWINSDMATPYTGVPITQLGQMALTGTAATGGASDTATLDLNGTMYSAAGNNLFPDLGTNWQTSEFNIFGDCCNSSAVFNSNAQLQVQTAVNYGSSNAPNCGMIGFTGETNNLALVNAPSSVTKMSWPSIVFNENNLPNQPAASCATATSWGDTHIITFSGASYDFQAAGTFLLFSDSASFSVYSTQISGAPSWPNTSINTKISIQMGDVTVVVPAAGNTLQIGGMPKAIQNGMSGPYGSSAVQIVRNGAGYLITDQAGNAVQLNQLSGNPNYINAYVYPGLPLTSQAQGVLVGKTSKTSLSSTVTFKDLYTNFAQAWKVTPGKAASDLSASQVQLPTRSFYAKDLTPAQQEKGLKVCKTAGITNQNLLESCILDVIVLGSDQAAEVFKHLPEPTTILHP
jgi:hypothetical protein